METFQTSYNRFPDPIHNTELDQHAVPSRERLLEALPTLPAADAYLVRRVHLEGQNVATLAATWGMEPSRLESRLRDTQAAVRK